MEWCRHFRHRITSRRIEDAIDRDTIGTRGDARKVLHAPAFPLFMQSRQHSQVHDDWQEADSAGIPFGNGFQVERLLRHTFCYADLDTLPVA